MQGRGVSARGAPPFLYMAAGEGMAVPCRPFVPAITLRCRLLSGGPSDITVRKRRMQGRLPSGRGTGPCLFPGCLRRGRSRPQPFIRSTHAAHFPPCIVHPSAGDPAVAAARRCRAAGRPGQSFNPWQRHHARPSQKRPDGLYHPGQPLPAGLHAPLCGHGVRQRDRRTGGHQPCAGAYGLQGHGKASQGAGGPGCGIPGRLSQRGHQLRQDLVHHRHARQALEDGHGRGQGHGLPSRSGSGRAGGGKGCHRFRAQGR